MKNKKIIKPPIEIKEKVVFEFAHEENATRIGIALSTIYFIKITKNNGIHRLHVYEFN